MNDLELHKLVKTSVQELKPEYQPAHWRQMQAKLILAPIKFPWKIISVVATASLSSVIWWQSQSDTPSPKPVTSSAITIEQSLTRASNQIPQATNSIEKFSVSPVSTATVPDQPPQQSSQPMEPATLPQLQSLTTNGFKLFDSSLQLTDLKTYFIEKAIRDLMLQGTINGDSTTFKVLDRNKSTWDQAAVVCDWSSSMFPYGTQIFTWLGENKDNQSLIGYLFFNDCDAQGNPLSKSPGEGGMYFTREKEPNKVLGVMIDAVRHGVGNTDLKENDFQALIEAQKLYPDAEELVLIADNVSPVRYPHLMDKINKPVRVIICGATLTDQAIQPIYLQLAQATGGSIHTIEDDLLDVEHIAHGRWIKVGEKLYRFHSKKGRFVETNRKKRPKQ